MTYNVQSPVLFLNFNRPDLTLKIFNAIREVKPPRLYIAIDGPRPGNENDVILCKDVEQAVSGVDWPCSVYKRVNAKNLGCKRAVSSAISWFFEQEEEGIILEDDCLPGSSFFYFCDSMLQTYRFDTRIGLITGTNLQDGIRRGTASYYFSQYSNIWGWASWRRMWNRYDPELERYDEQEAGHQLRNIFSDPLLVEEWLTIFRQMKAGQIDTWDYQLTFINFFENRFCVTPNINLISNLGFRKDATHYNTFTHNAGLPIGELNNITAPHHFLPDKEADYYLLAREFHLGEKWRKHEKDKLLRRRIKNWVKGIFKDS